MDIWLSVTIYKNDYEIFKLSFVKSDSIAG